MPPFGYHPHLTTHAETARAMYGQGDTANQGVASQVYGDIDNTPKSVALIGLGMLGILFALEFLGFRFVIGVGK